MARVRGTVALSRGRTAVKTGAPVNQVWFLSLRMLVFAAVLSLAAGSSSFADTAPAAGPRHAP
jgi:hypothetical protein